MEFRQRFVAEFCDDWAIHLRAICTVRDDENATALRIKPGHRHMNTQRVGNEMYVRFSPATVLEEPGSRVDRTGCLGRWILLPLRTIIQVNLLRMEEHRGRQIVVSLRDVLENKGTIWNAVQTERCEKQRAQSMAWQPSGIQRTRRNCLQQICSD